MTNKLQTALELARFLHKACKQHDEFYSKKLLEWENIERPGESSIVFHSRNLVTLLSEIKFESGLEEADESGAKTQESEAYKQLYQEPTVNPLKPS